MNFTIGFIVSEEATPTPKKAKKEKKKKKEKDFDFSEGAQEVSTTLCL